NSRFYVKNGFANTNKPPFRNQRYKCKECFEQFSANTFKLDYRRKLANLSENVLHYVMNGMSNNSTANLLKVSEATVRDRITGMSRQAVFFEKENEPSKIQEDVAYDGFETFTHS